MLERLLILVLLVAAVATLALIVKAAVERRNGALRGASLPPYLRQRVAAGSPTLLYFFGPHCASCRQQSRVLDQIEEAEGIATVRIDSVAETETARWFGIMTVPTTVVVDGRGNVRDVLPGFQSRQALLDRL